MNKHDGCNRAFVQVSRAWNSSTALRNAREIFYIGFYHPEGGATGEFNVEWEKLSGRLRPILHAYDDSWSALYEFSDLLQKMAEVDGQDITPDQFRIILIELGIKDVTPLKPAD